MKNLSDFIHKLEKHETKDVIDNHINGSLTVIWRDYDKIIADYPKMIYVSSVNPGELKGPHLHTKRNSHFICIHGKVIFIIKNSDGEYLEVEADSEEPVLISVPKNYASAHINITDQTARILALADISWKPDDTEMKNVQFTDYDWQKWKTDS
jgi:dTDP-4-dehydrorhamnose 3,5-epimerase-like enzyme